MQSAIGRVLADNHRQRRLAVAVALATLLVDFAIIKFRFDSINRGALAVMGLALTFRITNWDPLSIGFRLAPKQGWRSWIRTSAIIGVAVLACIAIGLGGWALAGNRIPLYTIPPGQVVDRFLDMCFTYPTIEEAIYRVVICVPLVHAVGCWKTIATSGVLFGLLHVVYGNPSPENLVGGFFLAWAYLKSESILIPYILHAGGNLIVWLGQIAGWHFLEH